MNDEQPIITEQDEEGNWIISDDASEEVLDSLARIIGDGEQFADAKKSSKSKRSPKRTKKNEGK